jgi:hypothetical protein
MAAMGYSFPLEDTSQSIQLQNGPACRGIDKRCLASGETYVLTEEPFEE